MQYTLPASQTFQGRHSSSRDTCSIDKHSEEITRAFAIGVSLTIPLTSLAHILKELEHANPITG
jgi:hypothetical protein